MKRALWIAHTEDEALMLEALAFAEPKDRHFLLLMEGRRPLELKSLPVRFEGVFRWPELPVAQDAQEPPGVSPLASPLAWTRRALAVRALRRQRFDKLVIIRQPGWNSADIEGMCRRVARGRSTDVMVYAKAFDPVARRYARESWFWYFRREYFFNRQGFRGPECLEPKAPGEYRVFCLGGSTTYGSGSKARHLQVEHDEAYPHHLQELLDRALAPSGRRARVLNLGVTGMAAGAQASRLRTFLTLAPDLVVIHAGYNDLPIVTGVRDGQYTVVTPELERPEQFQWLVERYRNMGREKGTADWDGAKDFSTDIFLGHDLSGQRTATGGEEVLQAEFERRYASYQSSITALVRLCLDKGIKVIFALQPRLLPGHTACLPSFREPGSAERLAVLHQEQRKRIRAALEGYTAHPGFRMVDLMEAFRGDEADLYIDECHLSSEGNRRIAGALAEQARPLLLSAAPRPQAAADAEPDPLGLRQDMGAFARWASLIRRLRARGSERAGQDNHLSPFNYPLH